MGSQLRKQDESREQILTQYLKDSFQDKMTIINTKELQIKGIDAFIDGIKVDFKGQLSDKYVNNPTNTFALELLTLNRAGQLMDGWFIDKSKETEEYGFCWINKCETNPFKIQEIEYMQINIQKLRENLAKRITYEKMMQYANLFQGTTEREIIDGDLKIVSSGFLTEQPVNLVVSKDFLKRASTIHKII